MRMVRAADSDSLPCERARHLSASALAEQRVASRHRRQRHPFFGVFVFVIVIYVFF